MRAPDRRCYRDASSVLQLMAATMVLAAVVGGAYLIIRAQVIDRMITQPVVLCLVLDCFLIHAWTGASRREALATVSLAAVSSVLWLSVTGSFKVDVWRALATFGFFLGLSSLFVLSATAVATRAVRRDKFLIFGRSSIFLCLGIWSIPFLSATDHVIPGKLDALLYRFDAGFGIQPSFVLGKMFASNPGFSRFETALYLSLALPVALVYIGHLRRAQPSIDVLHAFVSNCIIAYLLYWIFPAVGPVTAFAKVYPSNPPLVSVVGLTPIFTQGLPNAIPSVHVSTALLIWFNTRPWRWARMLSLFYLILTILATLGLGEHYVIDLIVAFPYVLLVQALAVSSKLTRPFWVGACLTAGWLILLRFGAGLLPSPTLAYFVAPLTVALVLREESRLAKLVYDNSPYRQSDPISKPAIPAPSTVATRP